MSSKHGTHFFYSRCIALQGVDRLGYRIVYDSGTSVKTPIREPKSRLLMMICGCLLLFGLLTKLFWPAGADKLRSILIPGDPDITTRAASEMVEDLRSGMSVEDAVQAFCREILNEAGYPD